MERDQGQCSVAQRPQVNGGDATQTEKRVMVKETLKHINARTKAKLYIYQVK